MVSLTDFINYCNNRGEGDIVEFGTFSGNSTKKIASEWNKGILFTIDGWKGLPKSEKKLPSNGVWNEGAFTGNKSEVVELLLPFNHVKMIDSWINKLNEPDTYGIGTLVGSNIDVDIYESTIDSLKYLDKCRWLNNELIVRFDDWDHHGTKSFRDEIAQHNKLAWSDFLKETGYKSEKILENQYVAIFKLIRQ